MRFRQLALASAAGAIAAGAAPAIASAHHAQRYKSDSDLTITANPDPVQSGAAVTIYGQLTSSSNSGQTVDLYDRAVGGRTYTLLATTTTDSSGNYEFTRAAGTVTNDRDWYVTAPSTGSRSHVLVEDVQSLISASASTTTALTNAAITFTGTVTPAVTHGWVALQVEGGVTGNSWRTVAYGRVNSSSDYTIKHRFRTAGEQEVRVEFLGNDKNSSAASSPIAITVQQAQNAGFTIKSSAQPLTAGSSATISGVVDTSSTSTTADAGVSVALYGKTYAHGYKLVATTTTGSDGSYAFTVSPTRTTVYQARLVSNSSRRSTALFEGVKDTVTFTPSTTSTSVGDTVTFSGTVGPTIPGHAIYLQAYSTTDSRWHTVQVGFLSSTSTYSLSWTAWQAGSVQLRVLVPGGQRNFGVVSSATTITVATSTASAIAK